MIEDIEYKAFGLTVKVSLTENKKDIAGISYKYLDTSGEIPLKIIQIIPASLNYELIKDSVWMETKLPYLFPSLGQICKKINDISPITDRLQLYTENTRSDPFLYVFTIELAIYLVSNHLVLNGIICVPDYPNIQDMTGLLLTQESIDKMALVFRIWCLSCDEVVAFFGNISLNFCVCYLSLFQKSDSVIEYFPERGIINACTAAVDKLNTIIANHKMELSKEIDLIKEQLSDVTEKIDIIEGEFVRKV